MIRLEEVDTVIHKRTTLRLHNLRRIPPPSHQFPLHLRTPPPNFLVMTLILEINMLLHLIRSAQCTCRLVGPKSVFLTHYSYRFQLVTSQILASKTPQAALPSSISLVPKLKAALRHTRTVNLKLGPFRNRRMTGTQTRTHMMMMMVKPSRVLRQDLVALREDQPTCFVRSLILITIPWICQKLHKTSIGRMKRRKTRRDL